MSASRHDPEAAVGPAEYASLTSGVLDEQRKAVLQDRLRVLENQNAELEQQALQLHEELSLHRVAMAELRARSAELMQQVRDQRQQECRYRQLYDLAPVSYLTLDQKGFVEQVNLAATCLLQVPSRQLLGAHLSSFLCKQDMSDLGHHLDSVAEAHLSLKRQVTLELGDGSTQRVMLVSSCIRPRGAAELKYQIMLIDISQQLATERLLRSANDYLEKLAHRDPLTDLPNRTMFHDRLQTLLSEQSLEQSRLSVIYFDLDGFKPINDTLGHHVGDQVLCTVSERVRDCLKPGDMISRMGGDEFALILQNPSNENDALSRARQMARIIAEPMKLDGGEVRVTSSMGVSLYPEHALNAGALVKGADAAMYQAKQAGRGQVCLFSRTSVDTFNRKSHLETSLGSAVSEDQFELHYQPIYTSTSLTIESIEALIRWEHPTLGFISPQEFIPLAEKSDRIVEVGNWVLETACRQIAEWRRQGFFRPVAINVSSRQLFESDFSSVVKRALERHEIPSSSLEIEITESALMIDHQRSRDTLDQLKQAGHVITIDDFGTGHSSLSRLVHLPVSRLKIDQMFIRGLDQSEQMRSVVTSIIAMAHRLGMRVVSEGVEHASQLSFLAENHCDAVQGFMMSRAELPSDITRLLRLDDEKPGKFCQDLPRLGLARLFR